jgi:hypothetical protein
MDLVTQFSDKTFLSAQLKSNLKKSARLIATIKPSQEPCLTSLKNAIGENLDNSIFKELQLSNRRKQSVFV